MSNNEIVDFSISLNGFESENVSEDGIDFNRIIIPEGSSYSNAGSPNIMMIRKLVAIPECGDVTLSIAESNNITLDNYYLYPVPKQVSQTDNNGLSYVIDQYFYESGEYSNPVFSPAQICELGEIGYFRGQKFAEVFIYPLTFNPITHQIKIYTDIEICLSFLNASGPLIENTGIFNGSASSTFINYPSNGITAIVNDRPDREGIVNYFTITEDFQADYLMADYLIIADNQFYNSDSTSPSVISPGLDLIAHHRADYNGFVVTVVNVQDINEAYNFDTDDLDIKEFIKRVYMGANAPNMGDGQ